MDEAHSPAIGPDGGTPRATSDAPWLAGQTVVIAGAALPLPEGLRALAEEAPNRRLRRAVRDLATRIEAGDSLEAALDAAAGRMPDHFRALLAAGVQSGRLPMVLDQYADQQRIDGEIGRTLKIGLLYPALLFLMFSLIFLGIYGLIVPQLRTMFADLAIPLPWISRVMLSLSDSIRGNFSSLGLRLLVAVAAVALAWRLLLNARERRLILVAIPLVGSLWRWSVQARYCQHLALMIDAELPMPRAVELAALATHDPWLQDESREMVADLERGRSLADAMTEAASFPAGVAVLVRWVEGGQSAAEVLRTASGVLIAHARSRASVVASIFLILVLITILVVLIFTILGLFLPLIGLISQLSS